MTVESNRLAQREWRRKNPEKHLEVQSAWRAQNPEAVKGIKKRWNNSELGKLQKKLWAQANRDKLNEASRLRKLRIRQAILDAYGRTCAECGFMDTRALDLDHINNDGGNERKRLKVSSLNEHVYRNNFPDTYQLLCRNCNWLKYLNSKIGNEVE